MPIGASRRNVRGLDRVFVNCAVCHSGTVRNAPTSEPQVYVGMPANSFDIQKGTLDAVVGRHVGPVPHGSAIANVRPLRPQAFSLRELAQLARARGLSSDWVTYEHADGTDCRTWFPGDAVGK